MILDDLLKIPFVFTEMLFEQGYIKWIIIGLIIVGIYFLLQ